MRIKIKNLGPIYEFNFDLNKDLHLVYGKNNIGKSHGIAAVYLILKTLADQSHFINFRNISSSIEHQFTSEWNDQFIKDNSLVKTYEDLSREMLNHFFNSNLLPNLNKSFINSFSELINIENKFSQEKLSIDIYFDIFDIKIEMNEKLDFFVSKITIRPHYDELQIKIIFKAKMVFTIFLDMFRRVLDFSDAIYFLPASRSGLYQGINSTAPILAEISRIRHLLPNKTFRIPTYSEPVSDYFLQLMSVNPNGKSDAFNRIAEKIENDILQGTIVFNDLNKKYEYIQHQTNMRLDVTSTSSMISELAPFVAFLKYILKQRKIEKIGEDETKAYKCLFIEEPEAHLHPSVQVVLMQLFTEMANNGVKIIMTTHSDFMFNELSNLILDNKIKAEQVSSMHLVMTEKGSIDQGDMQATADGIDDYNFSEVAENQYERRMNLLDLKNQ